MTDDTAIVREAMDRIADFVRGAPWEHQPAQVQRKLWDAAKIDLQSAFDAMSRLTARLDAGWQPIETAPRDGTWFLICREDEDDFFEVGCFNQLMWPEYIEAGDGLYRRVEKPIHDWRGFNNFHRATHWLPFPTPPEADHG